MITLVTGGARSGKSRYALELSARYPSRAFIATAEPLDDEMRERILRHKQERGESYACIEEAVDLAGALQRLPAGTAIAVVDCLSVWLGNLFHRRGKDLGADFPAGPPADPRKFPEIGAFLAGLAAAPCALVLVSNEVGSGIVPADPLSRGFVDLLGRINQEVAARAERVVLMVSGLPLAIKGRLA
jgi:adenosylcobinamide kinase / adenosylcobinamide-phosphate guanylyltransferase